jgi:hypothetical protein
MTSDRPDHPASLPDDAKFDAAWRAASREEPRADLDTAIRAAARRAVAAGPRPADVREATRPERWWWPLAAAATIGAVAVGVLQVIGPDAGRDLPAGGPAVVSDMPAEASAPSKSAAPVQPPAPRVETAAAPPARPSSPAERAATPAPARDAAPMRDQVAEPFPAGSAAPMAKRAAELSAVPSPARPSAGAIAGAAKVERSAAPAPLSVSDWIALIRRLRSEGRDEEAAKEIAAFRAAHPDLDPERLLAEDPRAARPAEK